MLAFVKCCENEMRLARVEIGSEQFGQHKIVGPSICAPTRHRQQTQLSTLQAPRLLARWKGLD